MDYEILVKLQLSVQVSFIPINTIMGLIEILVAVSKNK